MASCRSEKSRLAGVSSTEITIPSKGPARRMGINPWDCNLMWAMRGCPGGKEKGDLFEIPFVDDFSADYSRLWPYSSLFGLHWFE